MARTSNVFAKVEPEAKQAAEIPFEIKLPYRTPLVIENLTKEQFDAEITKGIDDIENGRVYSIDEVENEMQKL